MGSFVLPGDEEGADDQENNGQFSKLMDRIFKNSAFIDESKSEPGEKAEPAELGQNRTDSPVALNRSKRQPRL